MTPTIRKRRTDKGIRERFGRTHDSHLARQWVNATGVDVTRHSSLPSYTVVSKPVEDAPTKGLTSGYGPPMSGWFSHEIEDAPNRLAMASPAQLLLLGSANIGGLLVWPSHEPLFPSGALANTLALEQNSVTFEPLAMAILGRIFDRGHATCEDLADWLESPDEWIAFSRLQRARLLYDAGTEFTLSPEGRALVQQILSQSELE